MWNKLVGQAKASHFFAPWAFMEGGEGRQTHTCAHVYLGGEMSKATSHLVNCFSTSLGGRRVWVRREEEIVQHS